MAAGAAFLTWLLNSRNKVEDDLGIKVTVDSDKIRRSLINVVDLDRNGVFDMNDFEVRSTPSSAWLGEPRRRWTDAKHRCIT